MQLQGIHHLTAITAQVRKNLEFYTEVLGLRLVKKTVNQDDVSSYHLFYADAAGSPGTDITFFDWPARRERRGTNSIVRTAFRVGSESMSFWRDRLDSHGISHAEEAGFEGRPHLRFEDQEGQRLAFVADEKSADFSPWNKSSVSVEHQIRGLGPITMSVPELEPTDAVVTGLLNMSRAGEYTAPLSNGTGGVSTVQVYRMGEGGPAAELHVAIEPLLAPSFLGAGGVHHVAFRVPTFKEYEAWSVRLQEAGMPYSGPIDRFYFKSLYFRDASRVLFELATDEPGFAADESLESLGEKLALPPFLEGRRAEIEAGLKPL